MSSSISKSTRKVSIVTVICITALVSGLLLAVAGCGSASIVGKWVGTDGVVIEFTSDGKVLSEGQDGVEATYVIKDGKMTISTTGGMQVGPFDFELDGDSLTVVEPGTGEPDTLTRVK